MDRFAELVGQRTNNRIRMRTFHSAQLGQQDEAIQQMRLGTIDFANFNLSPLNNLAPSTAILTLPFLFRDVGHSHRVVDGAIGEDIARDLQPLHNPPGAHARRCARHENPCADFRSLDRHHARHGRQPDTAALW
jgi:TRAP-type C4-dicarboxylate transport system substrate-binding protein